VLKPASLFVLLATFLVPWVHAGAAPATRTDAAADYALAACLTQRATGPLRDAGYRLGSIAIHELGLSALDFDGVQSAVRRELVRRPLTTVHVDAPVDRSDQPALLAHCLAVSRSAPVRAALSQLKPARPHPR
jgi:hypothetical protein